MIFSRFKELKKFGDIKLEDVVKYLTEELRMTFVQLHLGLRSLSFEDNFESFLVEVTIDSSAEKVIRNQLTVIPSKRIIVRGGTGAEKVVDGPTEWTKDYVYLKNTGASAVTVSVLFVR